ncbi:MULTISPECIES: hypothetical protein [Gordonia]|uniref:Uncharacterized protein n=1 Tax=Gordonia amicalis TaxID=89053 RepID=A0AAE4R4V7_9ACTN|nr:MULTISPECIES: hypothetical protein [Gordonia]ATD71442.1 hypothetical protein CNO18_15415 [Gordonia sp. 1D]MCR8896437.1 hypothetical protein [Gordonia sp. GONU]MCZ4580232.1 hypothetical protein [Gordonia amicalis]MCZ4650315.1 hypothetical protein [Gordonia amicalis]MDJ0452257.1 hypothetical protein [Gordonia amicalis]
MSSSDSSGPRDLNGRVVARGRLARLRSRLRSGGGTAPLGLLDEVVVVAGSDDDAIASSVALDESSWRGEEEVILRHDLELPADRVSDAAAVAALDGYEVVGDDRWGPRPEAGDDRLEVLVLARVQLLDAMHLSQERSRMASLGSRHGGIARRWSVLQRPAGGAGH